MGSVFKLFTPVLRFGVFAIKKECVADIFLRLELWGLRSGERLDGPILWCHPVRVPLGGQQASAHGLSSCVGPTQWAASLGSWPVLLFVFVASEQLLHFLMAGRKWQVKML